MIPRRFHVYPDAATMRVVAELCRIEFWCEKRNALMWVLGIYVRS
jgi:hypothetical protein